MITRLRFIERDGKKILQQEFLEQEDKSSIEGPDGMLRLIRITKKFWKDVPLETEDKEEQPGESNDYFGPY